MSDVGLQNRTRAVSAQLGQKRPGNTNATSLVAVSSVGPEVTIVKVHVCNTSATSQTFRLFHDDDGTTYDETTALVWDKAIAAGGYEILEAASEDSGYTIGKSGNLGCRSSATDALTFTAYGIARIGR